MGGYIDLLIRARQDIQKLQSRNARPVNDGKHNEGMSERDFVRAFGAKVKRVRYSNRSDFVGLLVCGANTGFWVVRDKATSLRKIRVITILKDKVVVTGRVVLLKQDDSLTNMQRGLLRWVQ